MVRVQAGTHPFVGIQKLGFGFAEAPHVDIQRSQLAAGINRGAIFLAVQILRQRKRGATIAFGGRDLVGAAFQRAQVAQHVDRQRMPLADFLLQLHKRIAQDADGLFRVAAVRLQRRDIEQAFGHPDFVMVVAA
jgi:hypothetical protein